MTTQPPDDSYEIRPVDPDSLTLRETERIRGRIFEMEMDNDLAQPIGELTGPQGQTYHVEIHPNVIGELAALGLTTEDVLKLFQDAASAGDLDTPTDDDEDDNE